MSRPSESLAYHERARHIAALFPDCPRVPERVLCGNCLLGPSYAGVEHYAPVAEDSVCLWPCRHEVQRGIGSCLAGECAASRPPDAVDQGAPF